MEDEMQPGAEWIVREIDKEGAHLTIIATMVEENLWRLEVKNAAGISSNWLEFFPTAQAAIDAGLDALEKEGIEPFVDVEGFEYLNGPSV